MLRARTGLGGELNNMCRRGLELSNFDIDVCASIQWFLHLKLGQMSIKPSQMGGFVRKDPFKKPMSQLKKSREDGEDSEVQYDVFLYTSEHNAQWYLTKILQFVV